MGETENPVNSGVSDPTKSETTPEGGNGSEETPGEKEEVILEDDDLDETDSEEEVVTEETSAEVQEEQETVTEETEEIISDVTEVDSELDSLVKPAATKVIVKGVATDKDGKESLTDLTTAEVIYTRGCVEKDGSKMREGADVTFRVLSTAGNKVTGISYAVAEKEEDLTLEAATSSLGSDDAEQTISSSQFSTDGKNDKNVLIVVRTEEIKYTVSFNAGTTGVAAKTFGKNEENKDALLDLVTEYTYTKANSIKLAMTGMAAGKTYKVEAAADGSDQKTELKGTAVAAKGDVAAYVSYTLNASALDGIAKYGDQTINVTVSEVPSTTVNATPITVSDTGWTDAGGTITGLTAKEGKTGYEAYKETDTYTVGSKVAFAVTDVEGWTKIDKSKITAKLTKGSDNIDLKSAITDAPAADFEIAEGQKGFCVELKKNLIPESGYALEIAVETELDDKAHKITFKHSAPAGVITIEGGESENPTIELKKDYVKTTADSYYVDITSREGYQIQEVKLTYKGKYTDEKGGTLNATDTLAGSKKKYAIANAKIDFAGENTPGVLVENKETKEKEPDGRSWAADEVAVEIVLGAGVEGADEEKTVSFTSTTTAPGTNPYKVEVATSDQVTFEKNPEDEYENNGTAIIAEGTQYLSFTVAAETEPEVKLLLDGKTEAEEGILELVSSASGRFEYRVAAKALIGIQSKINIKRATKDVTVVVTGTGATVDYEDTEEGSTAADSRTEDGSWTVAKDAPLEITVTPSTDKTTAPITSVTYQIGEKGAKQTASADSRGVYTFSVKASDNITVEVKKAEDERLFVRKGGEKEVVPANGTVEAGYEETIEAWLENKNGTHIALYNATVTDGGVIAETAATIGDDNVVSLKVAKAEYEKTLTVTLMKTDRTTVSFLIVSDKAADTGVSIRNADGEEVTADSLDADTVKTYQVAAESGNVKKLSAVLIATPDEAVKEIDPAQENATDLAVEINKLTSSNVLTVKAFPAKEEAKKAGTVLVFDKNETPNTEGKVPVLATLNLSVNAPVVLNVTADADNGEADGRSLPVIIRVPDAFKDVDLKEGAFGYEIKVTKPVSMTKPSDMSDDDWAAVTANIDENLAKYADGFAVTLEKVIADGGHTITVLSNSVKPVKLDGFSIEVTPVQYMDKTDKTDAEKKILGKSKPLTAGTTAPVYSDTLNLGKGEKTLITGQDKDVVVATPVFAKDAQYKRVEVEVINSITGIKSWNTQFTDNGDYLAKWNPVNGTVTVNAKKLKYDDNAKDYYKNLAVKVTAFTEKGDYGVCGVQKLTVKNGIENMTLDVQPEILFAGKKVTVKSTIDYNTLRHTDDAKIDKKMAPQKKAAVYSIVGEDGTEQSLSANLTAVVDAKGTRAVSVNSKTGQITVAAGFVPSKKAAENTFYLKAVAADYDGNKADPAYAEVEIVSTGTTLGTVAVFKYDDDKDAYTMMPAGDIPVDGSIYRLAVLKPGVAAKNTYNLETNGSGDALAANLFTFKSSNKSIVVDEDGDITVKKLGKTNFTVTARSDAKNKAEMKNVVFAMEKTDLYVEVTRYQDSTFKEVIDTKYFKAAGQIDITGNTTGYFSLDLVKKTGTDKNGKDVYAYFNLPNCSFGFKNAKKVTPVNGWDDEYTYHRYTKNAYFVATGSTGSKATIVTVTNKGVKPAQKFNITITNATAPAGNAPKLTLTDKKQRIAVGHDTWVEITVTAAKKGETIPADTYVMLSADQTKKTKGYVNGVFNGSLDRPIRLDQINDSTASFGVGMYAQYPESYTLIATLGTMTDGVFTQTHKEAKINLKAVKANENIKATTSYTLNPYGVSSQKLVINGGDGTVRFTGYEDTEFNETENRDELADGFNYAKNQIQKDGTPNEFNKYFKVTAKEGSREIDRIMVNPKLSYADLLKLDDKDFQKANTTGYITVTNGYKKVDVKLTVKLKAQKDLKLKASAAQVIEGKDVITDIQIMDGKTPVAIEQYTVSGGTSFKTYYTTEIAADADEAAAEAERLADGIIRVKAASVAKGTDKVDVKVLLADTAAGYRTVDDKSNAKPFDTYGITISGVSVKINANTTGGKVVLSNSDKNWNVQRTDWNAEGEFYGWSTVRDYSFKSRLGIPAGGDITVSTVSGNSATPYVSFESDAYNVDGRQELTIKLDKKKLQDEMSKPKSKLKPGAKVKAKAIFSYDQKDQDGNVVKSTIKSDEVTFNITLPEEEGYPSADALNDAITNDKSLQNLVDVKTADNHDYYITHQKYKADGKPYTTDDVKTFVEYELMDAVRKLAKGTSAKISVESSYADNLYTYTLTVEGKDHVYKTLTEAPTATKVAGKISELFSDIDNNTEEGKKTAEKLGLNYAPETTADKLAAALRKALAEENLMTRNISLSVSIDKCKAPTAAPAAGDFQATVTVKDSNAEPEYGNWTAKGTVSYRFPGLSAADTYTNALKTSLASDITALFSKAYSVTGDITDNEIGPKMQDELIKQIETYAQKKITNNNYLNVKGIDAKGFECNWDDTNSKWILSFDIVYSDSTPKAKTPEITVNVKDDSGVEVTAAEVESLKQADKTNGLARIQTAVNAAVEAADHTINSATTEAAAKAAIEKIVKSAIVSPAYDTAKSLLIEVTEGGEFVAPKGEANGKIDVTVTYNKDREEGTEAVKSDFTFIILPKAPTDPEAVRDEVATAKQLVTSTLTEAKVNAIVQAEYGGNADGTLPYNDAELLAAIKKAVDDSFTAAGIDDKKVKVKDAGVVLEETGYVIPADSKKTGKIPSIKVTLQEYKNNAWADVSAAVEITNITLKANGCYQSKDEFLKEIKKQLESTTNGLAYNKDYFDGTTLNKNNTTVQGKITIAIETKAGELAEDPSIATSKQWQKKKFAVETLTAEQIESWTNSKISVTLGMTGETVPADKRGVDVKLLTEAQTPTITGITLQKVTNGTKDATHVGNEAQPILVTNSFDTKDKTVTFELKVDATSGTAAEQKQLTWTVNAANGGTAPAGVKDIIEMTANAQSGTTEKATLTIPVNAYAADGKSVTVKLVGEIADQKVGGAPEKKKIEIFVKIELTEKVDSINLKNEARTADAQTTFEAPAAGTVTYTFNTELVGKHINTVDTKAVIQSITTGDAAIEFTPAADSKATLTVKPSATAKTLNVKATVDGQKPDPAMRNNSIKIIPHKTVDDQIKLALTTGGDTSWKAETGKDAVYDGTLTVSNKTTDDVKIPINITDTKDKHEWDAANFAVKLKTNGSSQLTGETEGNALSNTLAEVIAGRGADKDKRYLVIKNAMPELKQQKDDPKTEDVDETVAPVVLELTAASTADNASGKAAVTKTLTFALLVNKTYTEITAVPKIGESTVSVVNGVYRVEQKADAAVNVTLNPVVKGAHVLANDAEDQKVTCEITSQGAKSTARIGDDGKTLVIPSSASSTDNIIKVTITSKKDEKVSKTITFKVEKEVVLTASDVAAALEEKDDWTTFASKKAADALADTKWCTEVKESLTDEVTQYLTKNYSGFTAAIKSASELALAEENAKATLTFDVTKGADKAEAVITIDAKLSEVTGITITAPTNNDTVSKGDEVTCTATATGNNLLEGQKKVAWSVDDTTSLSDSASKFGEGTDANKFTVGSSETATPITLKATSVFDENVTETVSITVS